MRQRVMIVGEVNPLSADPEHALYPSPYGCSGHRLAVSVLGMTRESYLETFDRTNLCTGSWCPLSAELAAGAIRAERLILLGVRVARAFGLKPHIKSAPMRIVSLGASRRALLLPHPSGLCRVWNDPAAAIAARELARSFVPEAAHLIGVK